GSKHGLFTLANLLQGTGSAVIAARPAPTLTTCSLVTPCPNLAVGARVSVQSSGALDDPNGAGNTSARITDIRNTGLDISFTLLSDPTAVPTPGRLLLRGGFYAHSNGWFTHKKYAMFMHDPADFAAVAQGTKD